LFDLGPSSSSVSLVQDHPPNGVRPPVAHWVSAAPATAVTSPTTSATDSCGEGVVDTGIPCRVTRPEANENGTSARDRASAYPVTSNGQGGPSW
jgi:hypothetical protein